MRNKIYNYTISHGFAFVQLQLSRVCFLLCPIATTVCLFFTVSDLFSVCNWDSGCSLMSCGIAKMRIGGRDEQSYPIRLRSDSLPRCFPSFFISSLYLFYSNTAGVLEESEHSLGHLKDGVLLEKGEARSTIFFLLRDIQR